MNKNNPHNRQLGAIATHVKYTNQKPKTIAITNPQPKNTDAKIISTTKANKKKPKSKEIQKTQKPL